MKRVSAFVAMALAGALSVAACSSSSSPEPQGQGTPTTGSTAPATLTPVKVSVVSASHEAFIWYAIDSGIFKKLGLDVSTINVQNPTASAAAVQSGTVQFGLMTTPSLISAAVSGQDLKCAAPLNGLYSTENDETTIVASKKSGITDLKGLSGKQIVVVQQASISKLSLQIQLDRIGVEKSPTYISIPFPQMAQALASGRVDAAVIQDPFTKTALDAGEKALGSVFTPVFGNETAFCYVATGGYLKDNAKTAEAFKQGMVESITYAKDHQDEVKKSLVEHMGISAEEAQAQDLASTFIPEIKVSSIKLAEDAMVKHGWIKKTVDPASLVWAPAAS